MGKTVEQLGWLVQRLVENGVVRSDNKLIANDYVNVVLAARDYLLYQRKISGMSITNGQVTSPPSDYTITNNRVILEDGFCILGIDGAALIDGSGSVMPDLISPASPGAEMLLSNSMFCHYYPNTGYVDIKNAPRTAKKLRIYSIAGSSPKDVVSEDIAFMIMQQVIKLMLPEKQIRPDTSADGNNFDDYLKNQVRQFMNAPNNIA